MILEWLMEFGGRKQKLPSNSFKEIKAYQQQGRSTKRRKEN